MTTDEILERYGLERDDIAHFYPHGEYEGKPVVCDCKRCEGNYAFVRDDIAEAEWRYVLHSTGYEIIAYYPAAGLYLAKRIKPKPRPTLCWRCNKIIDQDSEWYNLSADKNIHPGHCKSCAVEMWTEAKELSLQGDFLAATDITRLAGMQRKPGLSNWLQRVGEVLCRI